MMHQVHLTNGFTGTQAAHAPDESLTRYRALFTLAPIAVYACDRSGVVLEYNQRAAELWGRNPQPGDTDEGAGFDAHSFVNQKAHSPTSSFGLLSVRERMLALGGRFELDSSPGHGTMATLVLPLAVQSVASAALTSPPSIREDRQEHKGAQAANSSIHSKIRVVVADDHAMVRQGLCGLLSQYSDIQVIGEAANGEEAVTLADRLRPDVVLMDINMPKMDGVEATRQVKRAHPGVVVIGLSIHTAGQVETAIKEAGARAFINKDAAVEELYHTIHTATSPVPR